MIKPKILCFGTLIVDIITSKIERIPNPGECIGGKTSINLGGNVYSMSVNLKRLLKDNGEVFCFGRVGNDVFGKMFEKAFDAEKILSHLNLSHDKPTSSNLVIQQVGCERRYIFDDGANALVNECDITNEIVDRKSVV